MSPSDRTRREVLRLAAGVGAGTALAGCTEITGDGQELLPENLPATGQLSGDLERFDTLLREFLTTHEIPGGVLGVAHDRETVVRLGYGHRDADRDEPTPTDTLFRIASLSKVFTRAAVRKLSSEGRLSLSEPAFDILGYEPLPGESYNARLDDVTVRHLLHHRGGWDRTRTYDPLFEQLDIALERGWERPPDERQLIRYMLSEPLQFDPGEASAYSNLGYLVLGHVVEAVTRRAYQEYLEAELLEPEGVVDVQLGRSIPADRPGRESWYFDERLCRNVAEMEPMELVRCPDGGFHLEAMSASGGHVASIDALLGFMGSYWVDGRPRGPEDASTLSFTGTLPGAFTLVLQHRGADVVVMFNQRGYAPNYSPIVRELRDAVDGIEQWPA